MQNDDDERTPAAAPIPIWIERSVQAGLKAALGPALAAIEDGCAKREERIVASEARILEAKEAMIESERRILAALTALGIEQLKLAQKASEAAHHALRDEFDEERRDSSKWRVATDERLGRAEADISELKRWRDTLPCPPPTAE